MAFLLRLFVLLPGFWLFPAQSEEAVAQENIVYPMNPSMTTTGIYLSLDGVTRFDFHTLTPEWQALEGLQTFEPVVTETSLLVGTNAGVFALSLETGNTLWHIPSEEALYSPVVSGSTAYISGKDGSLRAVNAATGEEEWKKQFSGWLYPPAVVGKLLVIGGEKGKLWGVSAADGKARWEHELNQELVYRPVATSTGPVFISTIDATVFCLNPTNGHLKWQTRLDSPATAAVDEQRLYLGHYKGKVTAHDPENGRELWDFSLNGTSSTPIIVITGRVIATTDDGNAVMLDGESGALLETDDEIEENDFKAFEHQADYRSHWKGDRSVANH